jgi:hypothetical protein
MPLTSADRQRLAQACEVLPPPELRPGAAVIIDGRRLRPNNPLAWRPGTIDAVERIPWLKDTPLVPRLNLPARGADGYRRREPVPAGWLLRRTPALMQTLQSLGLWREW